jgi:hypothetical protein
MPGKRGLIERDAESAWLSGDPGEAGALDDLIGHSITYRIVVGPRAGQKVFTLQSIAAQPERPEWPERERGHGAAEASGCSPSVEPLRSGRVRFVAVRRAALSTSRCNASMKNVRGCVKAERLAWSLIELQSHFVKLGLGVA